MYTVYTIKCTGILLLLSCMAAAQKIDRKAVVQRHNVVLTKADSLSSLTVGNGSFACTVDVTGLQSFPKNYEKGVSLGTQSEWGWHSFPDTVGYRREEALRTYHLNGRDLTYLVQVNTPERNKAAANWFRQNPHRLQLGNLGFIILKKNGRPASLADIKNIRQKLDMWSGTINSHFTVEDIPVDVITCCDANRDVIGVSVQSALLAEGRLKLRLRLPYPTGAWSDEGTLYEQDSKHQSSLTENLADRATIVHRLDQMQYYLSCHWTGMASMQLEGAHNFILSPSGTANHFSFAVNFTQKNKGPVSSFDQVLQSSRSGWASFWNSGGAVDFSGSTDKRAFELERRVVLSQYLLRAQEAGSFPPQETGLTYNSWFGKPHLEMHWWHAAHYALWGRTDFLEKSMRWYASVAKKARAIAQRQGFEGIRWQKMTDNTGDECPSSVGAFLIWQQPHFIYFAELVYRNKKNAATLNRYRDLVFATADFMASYPFFDKEHERFILGKGLIPAQERFKPEETANPPFELAYWRWALTVAQTWRQRLHLPRNQQWDAVLNKLSSLPIQDNKYLFTETATDSYTNPEFRTDHPAVLGTLGMLPITKGLDTSVMRNTFDWIWQNWTWNDTWGWDFPLTAMTATRLGLREKAMEALMMNIRTNTYLINGHNYQDERLRIYFPGNGGLLAAVALMCAGYDGSTEKNPGIPIKDWKVKWEGLRKMP
jgi:hypothetical protein